jgi:hypothetical protein
MNILEGKTNPEIKNNKYEFETNAQNFFKFVKCLEGPQHNEPENEGFFYQYSHIIDKT